MAETCSEQVPCVAPGCRVADTAESLETIPATIPLALPAVSEKAVDHVPVKRFVVRASGKTGSD